MDTNEGRVIGRVAGEVEAKPNKSGKVFARVNVATNKYWKDDQGNKQSSVTYIPVLFQGENVCNMLQKQCIVGRLVNITYSVSNSNKEENGKKVYGFAFWGEQIKFGPKPEEKEDEEEQPKQKQPAKPTPKPAKKTTPKQPDPVEEEVEEEEDGNPF